MLYLEKEEGQAKRGGKEMNIGIRLHDTAEGTLLQRLGYAKEQGFSCAHLAMSKALQGFSMQDAPQLLTETLARQVKSDFSAQGMECAVLGCYLCLADQDEETLKRTQDIYRAHLIFSRMMGAKVVGTETYLAPTVHFSKPAPVSEEAFQLFLKGLAPVVRWAEEEDAVLAIEPVFSHVISTPERAQRMLEHFRSDHLRIILDAVNLLSPQTASKADDIVEDALSRLGDRIAVLHLKDYTQPQPGDTNLNACACGTGLMRYEKLLAFGKEKDLPMTLENTVPENAEAARKYLEGVAARL